MLDMVTIADRVPSLVVIAWGRVFRIPTDDLAGQLPCHCRKRWALNVWWCCAASDAEGEGYLHMSDRRYVHVGGVVRKRGEGRGSSFIMSRALGSRLLPRVHSFEFCRRYGTSSPCSFVSPADSKNTGRPHSRSLPPSLSHCTQTSHTHTHILRS